MPKVTFRGLHESHALCESNPLFDRPWVDRESLMAKKTATRTYEEVVQYLRDHGFDVLEAPATPNRVFVKKYGVSAAIEKDAAAQDGAVKLFAKPGYLIGGEIARLVDKGYQKILKTTKTEIPATADHLKAIHDFSEELREAMGATSLYNEALGTVSDRYVYDRVKDRDEPEPKRPVRPWEKSKNVKGA
jgi:hypothetical protein